MLLAIGLNKIFLIPDVWPDVKVTLERFTDYHILIFICLKPVPGLL